MPLSLRFHETHRYAFPVTSASPYAVNPSPCAMTCVLHANDPYLAFLTQTTYDDEIVYLHLDFDQIMERVPTPPGRQTTSGMGFDLARRRLICCASTTDVHLAYVIDPETGAEIAARDLSADTVWSMPGWPVQATATNGFLFAQAGQSSNVAGPSGSEPQSTIQMRSYDGTLVGERVYDNREFTGMCKTGLGWTLTDTARQRDRSSRPSGNRNRQRAGPGRRRRHAGHRLRRCARSGACAATVGPSRRPRTGRHALSSRHTVGSRTLVGPTQAVCR